MIKRVIDLFKAPGERYRTTIGATSNFAISTWIEQLNL